MKNFNQDKIKFLNKIEPLLVLCKILRLPLLLVASFIRIFQKKKSALLSDGFLIGDTVLLRPLVKSLERNFDLVLYLGGDHSKQILQDTNILLINQKWAWASYDYSLISLLSHLKTWLKIFLYQPNIIIESRGDVRSLLFLYMTCPQKIAGYSFTGGKSLLDIEPSGMKEIAHLETHNEMLAKKLGLDYTQKDIHLKFTKEQSQKIGISFSGSQKLKNLPLTIANTVLQKMKQKGFKLTYFVAPNDYFYEIQENKNLLSSFNIEIWKGNFENYFKEFQKLKGYIGMDSAGGHIASMFQIPSLIFFGTQKSEYCKPISMKNLFILETKLELNCRPCDGINCTNSQTQKCLFDIPKREIEKKCDEFIQSLNEKKI